MKGLVEFINECLYTEEYTGRWYRGQMVGPYKTHVTLNFDKEVSYRENEKWSTKQFIKEYFDTLDIDEINTETGQQRFLFYLKEFFGNSRGDAPENVLFRKKDIPTIKAYVEKTTGDKLDNWKDKLDKDNLYIPDEKEPGYDDDDMHDYYLKHNVTRNIRSKYEGYIGKVIKITFPKWDEKCYSLRRLFGNNNESGKFHDGQVIYTYCITISNIGLCCIYVTDEDFSVLKDWANEINVEDFNFSSFDNVSKATDKDIDKFKKAFNGQAISTEKWMDGIPRKLRLSINYLLKDCPIK